MRTKFEMVSLHMLHIYGNNLKWFHMLHIYDTNLKWFQMLHIYGTNFLIVKYVSGNELRLKCM